MRRNHTESQIICDQIDCVQTRLSLRTQGHCIDLWNGTQTYWWGHARCQWGGGDVRRAWPVSEEWCLKASQMTKRKKAIGAKWVFCNKLDINDKVMRNKVMVVAKGYSQQEG